MREVWLVAGQELWVNLRRPAFIVLTLLVPALGMAGILILALLGGTVGADLLAASAPPAKATGYVDRNGLLATELPGYSGQFVRYEDEASAMADLLARRIEAYVVLPPDYVESGRVVAYRIERGFSTFFTMDETGLRRFLLDHLLTGRVDQATLGRALAPVEIELVRLDEQGNVSEEDRLTMLGDLLVPYLFALLFIVALYTASGYLLQGVAEEKEGRVIEVLLSSITPTRLLAGKILGLGALGLIQFTFWTGMGALVLGTASVVLRVVGVLSLSTSTLLLTAVYFALGYLLFATLMATVGSLGSSTRESQQIAGVFSFAAAIPWVLAGVVLNNPDAPVVVALSYVPLTAPVMMLLRLGFGQVPVAQVVLSLGLLVAAIGVSMWAGAKLFRVGLLMTGKRPSLRDLSRAFRQA